MNSPSPTPYLFAICAAAATTAAFAQNEAPERPHLDAILEKRALTPQEAATLNKDADPAIDVRDLVIFLNGQPISATFGTPETLAFHSQGSITLPIYFTKPVPSATTIKFDLGGTAVAPGTVGLTPDYSLTYLTTVPASATSHQLTINFAPQWNGTGGEKIIRLTINRNASALPRNGTFSTHLVRVRQFDAGEFVGSLSFEGASTLSATAVRMGINTDGTAILTFQPKSAILGEQISATWSSGFEGFPSFPTAIPVAIPGAALGKTAPINASLTIVRLGTPYSAANAAYLEGFNADNQPALFSATLSIHNLYGSGTVSENAFTINQIGRLALQPVQFLNTATPQ